MFLWDFNRPSRLLDSPPAEAAVSCRRVLLWFSWEDPWTSSINGGLWWFMMVYRCLVRWEKHWCKILSIVWDSVLLGCWTVATCSPPNSPTLSWPEWPGHVRVTRCPDHGVVVRCIAGNKSSTWAGFQTSLLPWPSFGGMLMWSQVASCLQAVDPSLVRLLVDLGDGRAVLVDSTYAVQQSMQQAG